MTHPPQTLRRYALSLLISGVAAALALAAAPQQASAQQNYNPQDGGELIQDVVVQLAGGDRANDQDEQIGRIGVEQCKNQIGDDLLFRFQLNPNRNAPPQSEITLDDEFLIEFPFGEGLGGSCDRNDQDACQRLDDSLREISVNEGSNVIEVDIDFETLLNFEDGTTEECRYFLPGQTQTSSQTLSHDAGNLADASDAASVDTGGKMDTGGNGGKMDTGGNGGKMDTSMSTDTGTGQATSGADRFYVIRLFLTGRRQTTTIETEETEELVDGPLLLDRTRPFAPSDLQAAATENTLKVRFSPPAQTDEVDTYHVFFSSSPLDDSLSPEKLEDQDGVTRKQLKNVNDGNEEITAEVSGLNQSAGSELFVAVSSRDTARNFSLPAFREGGVDVKQSIDFWEKYKEAGGAEPGGCACNATPGLPSGLLVAILGLGGMALLRRLSPTG